MNNDPIGQYDGLDAISAQHLKIENQDIYLLVLGAAHHFIDHDDEELVERFLGLMVELVPYMSNVTKVKLYEYLYENVHSGRDIAAMDKWEELLDALDDCPVIQSRIEKMPQ